MARAEDLTPEQLQGYLDGGTQPPHINVHLERRIAATSTSPEASSSSYGGPSTVAGSASPEDSQESSGNLLSDLKPGSLIKIGDKRNKDGEKPKRRGPKPDSKPALTRRQELNRQAQRTHRERKERYVKGLEEEVVRLRETFTNLVRDKTAIEEENRLLRALLDQHGIQYDPSQFPRTHSLQQIVSKSEAYPLGRSYDEIGIDFVLALEEPCMYHMKMLTNQATNDPLATFHGHGLMAACPPESHNMAHPEVEWGLKTYDLPAADLATLFHLSNRLQLEGELTPIAVWATITQHAEFANLTLVDFETIKKELLPKVVCHGFGAVVDEFEVHESLGRIFAARMGMTYDVNSSGFSSSGMSS